MNKISICGLAALLAAGFAACDDYEEPNPAPQTNAQGPVLTDDDVTVVSALTDQVYSLEQLNATNTPIAVATLTGVDLPEGYTLDIAAQVSADNFAHAFDIATTTSAVAPPEEAPAPEPAPESKAAEGEEAAPQQFEATLAPDVLQAFITSSVSKSPKEKTLQLRYKVMAVNAAGTQVAVGGPDKYYGPYDITVKPIPSDFVLEDEYYLVGTACGWDVAAAIKLSHSNTPGWNPYDDPVFTGIFQIDGDWWWKIVPESVYATGNWASEPYFGCQWGPIEDGDTALEGTLVGENANAGHLTVEGPYQLTINLEAGTYKWIPAIPALWCPGNAQGWNPPTAAMLTTDNYVDYTGYAHLDGEFKFTGQPDWDPYNWGTDGAGGLKEHGDNLTAPVNALYWVSVNLPALTYDLYQVQTMGVIGDATPAGWDNSTDLQPSADFLTWTGDIDFAGGEFKFRANNDWAVNLGGSLEDLTQGGANIASPGQGRYRVTLSLATRPYTATLVKL